MDLKQRDRLKMLLLFGFLAASLPLIILIWGSQMRGIESGSPGFYRPTQPENASFYLTRTAEYQDFALGTGTPEGGLHHRRDGQPETPSGHEHTRTPEPSLSLTPSPTIDWDALEEDQ